MERERNAMYCKNCGKPVPDDGKFCTCCGTATASQSSTYRYVPKNKAETRDGTYRYVPPKKQQGNTSKKDWSESSQPRTAPGKPKKKTGKGWKVAGWILALWAAFALYAALTAQKDIPGLEKFEVVERPSIGEILQTEPQILELPSVPADLQTHMLLQKRGIGACKALRGEVGITILFVDDSVSSWTQGEIDGYMVHIDSAVNEMETGAAKWGTSVNVTIDQDHCVIEGDATSAMAVAYVGPALSAAGRSVLEDPSNVLGVDEAPIVFVFNKNGRAHAYSGRESMEYCFLFSDPTPFRHELNHLFGAQDFYYHDDMVTMAENWLGESIMLDSSADTVDALTAYLIGWTDTLSADALNFLRATATISGDSIAAAAEENTYSGIGTRSYGDGSSYSGYMINGMPQGWGTFTFANGDVYEGNFQDGERTGTGYYYWSNGDYYEGEFLRGQLHGAGTLIRANGQTLSGTWRNSEFMG